MNLAVLLLFCKDSPRITDLEREWIERLLAQMDRYYRDQSGGREDMTSQVFDWFELDMTSDEWNGHKFGVGPVVRPMVEKGLDVDLSPFDHFALVIDKFDAALAAVSPTHPEYVHVGAQSLDPALLGHESGHFYGASHAFLDTPAGPAEYDDNFCIMGREGQKHSFVDTALNRPLPGGGFDTSHSDTGPGMTASTLRACGWLDLAQHGEDISAALNGEPHHTTVTLDPLAGAPAPGVVGSPVCAYADGLVEGQRLLIEFRARDGWDAGIPPGGAGWVVAHLTGFTDDSTWTLQIGSVEATAGARMTTSKGAVIISVTAASVASVTLHVEVLRPVPVDRAAPAVVSWGADRIDVFARGHDNGAFHKAWAQGWFPSQPGWDALDGGFTSPFSVAAWGPDRLDVFGVGFDNAMFHKAWANGWHPSQEGWDLLGGSFAGRPSVASWGPERLDVFGLGTDDGMWHKAWGGSWFPSQTGWEKMGGAFISPPAAVSWGPGRIDVFALGVDRAMFHKAWDNGWWPTPDTWEYLGGGFTSDPAVCTWGPDRIDVFALGLDGGVWHKIWAQGWYPSQLGWDPLGGSFVGAPTAVSWGPGRIDLFAVGTDGSIHHKAWAGAWSPEWENLGGTFASPPTAVSWAPGRIDVFAVGKNFEMWHKAWAGRWFPSPTGWEALGGGFV